MARQSGHGRGETDRGRGLFPGALQGDRCSPILHFLLHNALQAQGGRDAEAAAELGEHTRIQADRVRLGQLLTEEGDRLGQDPDAMTEVAELFLRLDREPMGLHWLFAALRKEPGHKRAHKALADYYERKGEMEEAEKYRRAGELPASVTQFPAPPSPPLFP